MRVLVLIACSLRLASGCSSFFMANDFRVSARTMDLGSGDFSIVTVPRGSKVANGSDSRLYPRSAAIPRSVAQ